MVELDNNPATDQRGPVACPWHVYHQTIKRFAGTLARYMQPGADLLIRGCNHARDGLYPAIPRYTLHQARTVARGYPVASVSGCKRSIRHQDQQQRE
jgi:hypothetical protein